MNSPDRIQVFKDTYALIADLWCNPVDTGLDSAGGRDRAARVMADLETIDGECADLLARFLDERTLAEEDYIDLFELNPQCALYLGSHSYDEPQTCAGAAVSDRNEYMIELNGIYRHFGKVPDAAELPDFLPLMVDFLSLTCESGADPVRKKFLSEYFLPFLPPLRSRLEELGTKYLVLLDALQGIAGLELSPEGEPS